MPSLPSQSWKMDCDELFKSLISLPKKERSLEVIINSIFQTYGGQLGKSNFIWGDSTPLNLKYVKEILLLFPQAKFIFLIRDGRDVVTSYKKGGIPDFGALSHPMEAAKHWNKSIEALDYLSRMNACVSTAKYENLVTTPEKTLSEIAKFLSTRLDEKMLLFHKKIPNLEFYRENYMKNLFLPLSDDFIGHDRQFYTEPDGVPVFRSLEKNLIRFGYL